MRWQIQVHIYAGSGDPSRRPACLHASQSYQCTFDLAWWNAEAQYQNNLIYYKNTALSTAATLQSANKACFSAHKHPDLRS